MVFTEVMTQMCLNLLNMLFTQNCFSLMYKSFKESVIELVTRLNTVVFWI